MLFTKRIEELIKLAIRSRNVKGEKPPNILLVADSEGGKTLILLKFGKIKGVRISTDLTYKLLVENILLDIERGNIKTLIIPDFIKILERSQATANNTLTLLLPLIEEGIKAIDVGITRIFKEPLRCNLITGITYDEFENRKTFWKEIGFFQRFIPVSWSYTEEQVEEIRNFIKNQKHFNESIYKFSLNGQKDVKLNPNLVDRLMPMIKDFSKEEKTYGFRLQERLQCLLKASALERKDNEVKEADVERLLNILEYVNLKRKPLKD